MIACSLTPSELSALIGRPAAAAYRAVMLAVDSLDSFMTFKYSSPPTLQQRAEISEFEQSIIDQALKIREATKIPFWEAIFSACILSEQCSDALLQATLYHHGQGVPARHRKHDLASGILDTLTAGDANNISLCSKVQTTDGACRHFNFLDFHCEVSNANTRIVLAVCRKLMPQGFLVLDSGDSYHAVSLDLVSAAQRVHVLGEALLISPIVDVTYIAHQLRQDSSSIRISKGGKARAFPIVVDVWCPQ